MEDEEFKLNIVVNERGIRALHSAVDYTLNKWSGQEEIDQEALIDMRIFLQGALFECEFNR